MRSSGHPSVASPSRARKTKTRVDHSAGVLGSMVPTVKRSENVSRILESVKTVVGCLAAGAIGGPS